MECVKCKNANWWHRTADQGVTEIDGNCIDKRAPIDFFKTPSGATARPYSTAFEQKHAYLRPKVANEARDFSIVWCITIMYEV